MTTPVESDKQSLLSCAPLSDVAREDLRARMTQPSRFYHDLRHLEVMWARHLRHGVQASFERDGLSLLIAAAIAYHDAVYVAGARDNEERSADLWLEVSATATNLGLRERLWVAETIRATSDHLGAARTIDMAVEGGYARQWVLDLDLSPLGEERDLFDRNMDLLRAEAEYHSVAGGGADLLPALRHFASAQPLYRCQPIASAYAEAAQRNFRRHLS